MTDTKESGLRQLVRVGAELYVKGREIRRSLEAVGDGVSSTVGSHQTAMGHHRDGRHGWAVLQHLITLGEAAKTVHHARNAGRTLRNR